MERETKREKNTKGIRSCTSQMSPIYARAVELKAFFVETGCLGFCLMIANWLVNVGAMQHIKLQSLSVASTLRGHSAFLLW